MRLPRFAILLLVLVVLASGCSSGQVEQAQPTPLPTAVKPTTIVQRGEVVQQISLGGKVMPAQMIDLMFAASGAIHTVYVGDNSYVNKGQLLADLDSLAGLETQLADARQAAESVTSGSQRKLRRAQLNLDVAQLNAQIAHQQGRSQAEIQAYDDLAQLAQMDLDDIQAEISAALNTDNIQQLQADIEKARLYAPADGVLVGSLQPGATAHANYPVGEIGDPTKLELLINGSDDDLKHMTEGMTVTVRLENNKRGEFPGILRMLPAPYGSGPSSTGINYIHVTLSKTPMEVGYHVGDGGNIIVTLANKPNTLWLPPTAIRSVAGLTFVYIQGPSGPQRINITTGIYNRDQVEITGGLSEGQVVIIP